MRTRQAVISAPREVRADGTPVVSTATIPPPIRQTVLGGPVDSSGYSAFGGGTGSTTVTASGTLTCTAANGVNSSGPLDKTFQITNPSWTGLSTNGTMYLYVDWNSGTPITGSVTLAPTYQWGGTYSTTNNQHTFNIQEMTMKVGNGATAQGVVRWSLRQCLRGVASRLRPVPPLNHAAPASGVDRPSDRTPHR